jgi:hypothetical protein
MWAFFFFLFFFFFFFFCLCFFSCEKDTKKKKKKKVKVTYFHKCGILNTLSLSTNSTSPSEGWHSVVTTNVLKSLISLVCLGKEDGRRMR